MIESASGVLEAAPNTAARQTPAASGGGIASSGASAPPSVAPMKNSGVTSPPRNPAPSVMAENRSLSANSYGATWPENAPTMPGTPRPRYSSVRTRCQRPPTAEPPLGLARAALALQPVGELDELGSRERDRECHREPLGRDAAHRAPRGQ